MKIGITFNFLRKGLSVSLIPLLNSVLSIVFFKIYIKNYSEVDLADLALITSMATIVGSINTLNINKALVLEKDDQSKASLVLTTFVLVSVSVLVSSGFFAFLDFQILTSFEAVVLGTLFVITSAVFKISQSLQLSRGKFTIQGNYILLSGQLNNFVRMIGTDARFLIYGLIMGNITGTLPIYRLIYNFKKKWSFINFKADIIKAKDFISYNTLGELLYVLSIESVVFYLSIRYDAKVLGSFVFANSILRMASNPFISVFSGMGLYEVANTESLIHTIKRLIINVAVVMLSLVVIYLFREQLNFCLELLVPIKWHYTISLIWLLYPIYAASIALSPFSRILEATRMQNISFYVHTLRFLLLLSFFGIFKGNFDTFIPLYVYLMLILNLPIILVIFLIFKKLK